MQQSNHSTSGDNSTKPTRRTFRHLFLFLLSGNFTEIFKIIKRRAYNFLRLVRSIFSFYFDNPAVVARRDRRRLKKVLRLYYDFDPSKDTSAKIKVALIIQDGLTYPKSSAFIRLISPLTDPLLAGKVAIKLFQGDTNDIGPGFDVCIVQRTAFSNLEGARGLVRRLKKHGTSLIVDSDDAFHAIDPAHPEHGVHAERLEAFDYLVENAQQVWLSTNRLVQDFKKKNKSSVLVPNSLDPRLWKPGAENRIRESGPLHIVYMGTVSHDQDFHLIMPVLEELALKYPGQFQVSVIGVAKDMPPLPWLKRLYQPSGYAINPRFAGWFKAQGPFDIGLSPLVDNDFNRNKSDIKCLDYLAAGILPVVSDLEPYRTPALEPFIMRVKNDPKDWQNTLEGIIADPDSFRRKKSHILKESSSYLWSERCSPRTAEELYKLLSKNT